MSSNNYFLNHVFIPFTKITFYSLVGYNIINVSEKILDNNRISKLKKLDMDIFNNKYEDDSNRRRYCFYSEYFENKPVLLDGDFGKEVINMFSNGYGCYLPLIRDLKNKDLHYKITNWLYEDDSPSKAIFSPELLKILKSCKTNCILVYKEESKKNIESNKKEDVKPINCSPNVTELFKGFYYYLNYIRYFIAGEDFPKILSPDNYETNISSTLLKKNII